jgi:hypothetical protein
MSGSFAVRSIGWLGAPAWLLLVFLGGEKEVIGYLVFYANPFLLCTEPTCRQSESLADRSRKPKRLKPQLWIPLLKLLGANVQPT